MPDTLSPTERAAIAAFPEALVQHIPRGVSGEGEFPSLRERIKREAMDAKRARYHAKRRRAMSERRRLVLELYQTGRDIDQIAAHVGVHPETVKSDLKAIREGGKV